MDVQAMARKVLLLGVDGGATGCRARLADIKGQIWGEGSSGPANIRFGLEESFAAVLRATDESLSQAGLSLGEADIVACLALAGASEPTHLAAARAHKHPFARVIFTTDAHAACVGAHGGRDGGIIIVGTGSVGWAVVGGREHRVGGWGFPVSDEGSGAWLGCEAARRVLWACDGRAAWTGLLKKLYERFNSDPHAIVRWMGGARPRDFAALAPLVLDYAAQDDATACELLRLAAGYIDAKAHRLAELGVSRLALAGGIAPSIEPWLAPATKRLLVAPEGDALSGALQLARLEAMAMMLTPQTIERG
jgi:glucosamine kinase